MNHARFWASVCVALDVSEAALETWIAPLVVVEISESEVLLASGSSFSTETVTKRYRSQISTAASAVLGRKVRAKITTQAEPLNNLNLKSSHDNNLNYGKASSERVDPPARDQRSSSPDVNLNYLKAPDEKKRGGVPRMELFTDETLKKAMQWGVADWFMQICIRDYGLYTVKKEINRIYLIPEGYFKPKYGEIGSQRGRIFKTEMDKLFKHKKQVS